METNTYQKFNKCIEKVFESTEDSEPSLDFGNLLSYYTEYWFVI